MKAIFTFKRVPGLKYSLIAIFTLCLFILIAVYSKFYNQDEKNLNTPQASELKPQSSVQLPAVNGANESWWQTVQKDIDAQQYYISQQKNNTSFRSGNPRNALAAKYQSDELHLAGDSSSWHINMKFLNISADGDVVYFPKKQATAK